MITTIVSKNDKFQILFKRGDFFFALTDCDTQQPVEFSTEPDAQKVAGSLTAEAAESFKAVKPKKAAKKAVKPKKAAKKVVEPKPKKVVEPVGLETEKTEVVGKKIKKKSSE